MANKRYDQFTAGTPIGSNITLFADASTGALNKCSLQTVLDTNAYMNPYTRFAQGVGSSIINFPVTYDLKSSSVTFAIGYGQLSLTAIWLPKCTVTGVAYIMWQAGAFTAANFNGIGLYQYTGSNLTLVATTANDANIWKGTVQAWRTVNFASAVPITAGSYYIATLANQSASTVNPLMMGTPVNNTSWLTTISGMHTIGFGYYIASSTSLSTPLALGSVSGYLAQCPTIGIF